MKNWVRKNFNPDLYDDDSGQLTHNSLELDCSSAAILLKDFLGQHIPELVEDLNLWGQQTQFKKTVYLFEHPSLEENILFDNDQRLYVRNFFYKTLTPKVEEEFISLMLFFDLVDQEKFEDLLIFLGTKLENFLKQRQTILPEEEYYGIYEQNSDPDQKPLLGLIFISLLSGRNLDELNLIEKKQLKEIYFPKKVKEMLGLEEDDYEYLQNTPSLNALDTSRQKKFKRIHTIINDRKVSLIDYVENTIAHKKILFWGMWSISPFLVWDINQLINLISQYKKVKKVYLDLPVESQPIIEQALKERFQEERIEPEVKKIFPSIVKDYAMETLPYLKMLERLHYLGIPFQCLGITGNEMVDLLPYLKDNKLVFEPNTLWKEYTDKTLGNIDYLPEEELIIFFYFLKPIFPIPPEVRDGSEQMKEVETLIHTDFFTGFGPKEPGNLLALYSRYQLITQHSFVIKPIPEQFNEEPIIFFPYQDQHFFKLEESCFNRFHLYHSLLYSTTRGGGGNHDWEEHPDHSKHRSRV